MEDRRRASTGDYAMRAEMGGGMRNESRMTRMNNRKDE